MMLGMCLAPRWSLKTWTAVLFFSVTTTSLPVQAPAGATGHETEFELTGEYSRRGADSCIPCHQDSMPLSAMAIFQTPHGVRTDPAAPFGRLQCETCHGPGKDHARAQRGGGSLAPAVAFGVNSSTPSATQNAICLDCHTSNGRLGWFGSGHENQSLPCAACHRIHVARDPVFDPYQQQSMCFECHLDRRANTFRPSNHPLRFGSMTCSSCHDAHNGHNESLLRQATVNETCYDCHAEKRGPFLWEHAPASENCVLCHAPHGSNHEAMLVKRPPLLCQQCHAPVGHPSLAFEPGDLENDFSNRFMVGRACLNCHSVIHGSNHPSGATLHR